jgi:hypothetical protein
MHSHHRIAICLGALALAAGVAIAAQARPNAPTGGWARISGPSQAGNQLGLARTADGVLHVAWNRGNTGTSIFETRISPAGRIAGTSTIATGWNGNGGLALLALPDKSLQLFASGTGGIRSFTAPEGGGAWAAQGSSWGGAVAESSGVIGATLAKDGQPVTAWRGSAAQGVPPASPPSAYEGGMIESFVATDAASGAVVLSGSTNAGSGGFYAQQVLPSTGTRVVIPPLAKDWGEGLSARLGQSGVYVAYADGKAAHLYRYGGASKTLARGVFYSATVCAGPEGRLWVAWGDGGGRIFVTRSSKGVGGFEPVQKLKFAQDALTFVQCEGSAGPLDLFASGTFGAGFSHTHLLARLSVRGIGAKGTATIAVRDAGDPVAGAAVAVGAKRGTTNARGEVTLALAPGAYAARVTAAGYAPASARVTVPKKKR